MLRMDEADKTEEPQAKLHSCGWPEDSFACKVRHIALHTGAANMKRQYDEEKRKERQVKKYGV